MSWASMLDLLRLKMPPGKAMLEAVVLWLTADLASWLARCTASDAASPTAGREAELICTELLSLCCSLCNLLILPKRPGLYAVSWMLSVALGLMLALVEPC